MPYNGSGTFTLPAGNPVVTGTTISSVVNNNTNSDLANGLYNAITRNGESPPTANLPMGTFKLTGLAAGTSTGDSARYDELILKANLISPVLVTPNLGTPSAGVLTNCTGTAAGLSIGGNAATATTVTTNANLTGAVTSVGNASSLGSFTSLQLLTALTDETGSGANVFATSPTLTSPAIAGTPTGVGTLTSGTAVASTSGTSIDFTGIPSWAKRITVMFKGVTLSASGILIQIGSGSVTTSGYASYSFFSNSGGTANTSSTAGYVSYAYFVAPTSGSFQLTLLSANTWVCNGALGTSDFSGCILATAGNSPALSGALDRVRITTISGSATFSAGSINIMYE